MKFSIPLTLLGFLFSCASDGPKFDKDKVCSGQSLKYLKNPRNRTKSFRPNPALIQEVAKTHRDMQLCYEDFKLRSGLEEFNTCLVVGIDETGKREFMNFDSREVELDQQFINCARAVAQSVPYEKYGTNYVLVQAYQFFLK